GIRDLTVTGVQTCALPISLSKQRVIVNQQHAHPRPQRESVGRDVSRGGRGCACCWLTITRCFDRDCARCSRSTARFKSSVRRRRSEERRVGKEGSWGWGRG